MKILVLVFIATLGVLAENQKQTALFQTEAEETLKSYRGFQRIEGGGLGFSGWLEAETEFPINGKMVARIRNQGGEVRIVNEALKPLLVGQTNGDPNASALNIENYSIDNNMREKDGLVFLRVRPKRKEVGLLDGMVFFRKETFELVRIEGKPSKDPSEKVWNEHVVKEYQRIAGVRVPVKITTTGFYRKWLIPIPSKIVVTCHYYEINGRKVEQ